MKSQSPEQLPLILVAFNRPEHTRQVLAALKQQNASNLYIFCDAPRSDADRKAVDETRAVIETVDWTKPFVQYNTSNQGLANNIRSSVDLIFQKEEEVILLEDDCVPQAHFLQFMFDCLQRYEANNAVFGISGYSVQLPAELRALYQHDVYFYPRIGSWGWATWKSRWAFHERDLLGLVKQCMDSGVDLTQGGTDVVENLELMLNGQLKDVWTFHWILSVYLQKGFYVYPTVSHIENIGMDGSGVHCAPTEKFNTELATETATRFPEGVVLDQGIYSLFRSFYDTLQGDVQESFRLLHESIQAKSNTNHDPLGQPGLVNHRLEVPVVGSSASSVQVNDMHDRGSDDGVAGLFSVISRYGDLFSSKEGSAQVKALLEMDKEIIASGAAAPASVDTSSPNGLLSYWAALVHFGRGEHDPALDKFQEAIKAGFTHPRILWYMAECLRSLGFSDEAAEQEKRLFELLPEFPR